MQQIITTSERQMTFDLTGRSESEFYRNIGNILPDIQVPNVILVSGDFGEACYKVGQRGTFVKDGKKMPSMFVTEEWNRIRGLDPSTYPETYLTCVNSQGNNYKFYHMAAPENGSFYVEYGRIGAEAGELFAPKRIQTPYPSRLFWIRYGEKVSKGYTDTSSVYLGSGDPQIAKGSGPEWELYEMLYGYARGAVSQAMTTVHVTLRQIEAARAVLDELGSRRTVSGFNRQLEKLLAISPRKARYVTDMFASDPDEFADIIEREENLITAMEGIAVAESPDGRSDSPYRHEIEVYEATEAQKLRVMNHVDDCLKSKVRRIWRVIPRDQQKAFDRYRRKNGIQNIRMLWHGSRNGVTSSHLKRMCAA